MSAELDKDGYCSYESGLSDDGLVFVLKIDSSVPMSYQDALLALATWLYDEAQELTEK